MTHSFNRESPDRTGPGGIAKRPSHSPADSGPETIPPPLPPEQGDPLWMFQGPQGLRAGWSILLFVTLLYFFANVFGTLLSSTLSGLHVDFADQTAGSSIAGESAWVLALASTLVILARLERRRFFAYHLAGPAAVARFFSGLVSGFAALSVLVGVLAWGGWMRLGVASHDHVQLVRHAALWAIAFLLVALTEEGIFRCFLQFTLARSLNFWWAIAAVAPLCLWEATHPARHGAGGVYAMALLGFFPGLYLQKSKSPRSGFWMAAWVSSTAFSFIHTGNNGETWVGILAAGAIGFVFCVSVRLTGSAWWAIGCHAAWDWAETYFYGTADSGYVASGHLLTTTPTGSALWSGGTDGPEGSILVLPVVLLLLLALLVLYGRKRRHRAATTLAEHTVS